MKGERVFVWVSHGDASVHDASTIDSLVSLMKEMREVLAYGLGDDEIQPMDSVIEEYNNFQNPAYYEKKLIKTINDFTHNLIGEWDSFEYGTGFATVR